MYAIVEIKGKQYKASEGAVLKVDRIEAAAGAAIEFDSVLMVNDGAKVAFGGPFVKGAKVKAVLQEEIKGDKIVIYKYKRTKDYRRKTGHRQRYSIIKVTAVSA
jgi:large subunit ribosomal protein L21